MSAPKCPICHELMKKHGKKKQENNSGYARAVRLLKHMQ